MAFSLPNPTVPTNGQPADATPILQNELAIAQAISAFDGSQINAKSVTETALADAVNPRLRGSETFANFVYTGCTWAAVSGLNGTMTGGTIYVNGYRTIVAGVGSNTFSASSDTYIDIDYLGNVTYLPVSNNATAPSLTANSVRVAKIVTNGSTITSILQSQNADGIGNIIYPTGPGSTTKLQNPADFSVYLSTTQTITSTSTQIVLFDKVLWDSGANVDIVTHKGRFIAKVPGTYHFDTGVLMGVAGTNNNGIFIYKNGAVAKQGSNILTGANNSAVFTVGGNLRLAVSDYVEIAVTNGSGVGVGLGFTSPDQTWFDGYLVNG